MESAATFTHSTNIHERERWKRRTGTKERKGMDEMKEKIRKIKERRERYGNMNGNKMNVGRKSELLRLKKAVKRGNKIMDKRL
jgi:hypothetical protein